MPGLAVTNDVMQVEDDELTSKFLQCTDEFIECQSINEIIDLSEKEAVNKFFIGYKNKYFRPRPNDRDVFYTNSLSDHEIRRFQNIVILLGEVFGFDVKQYIMKLPIVKEELKKIVESKEEQIEKKVTKNAFDSYAEVRNKTIVQTAPAMNISGSKHNKKRKVEDYDYERSNNMVS